jgi:hypothetical protein
MTQGPATAGPRGLDQELLHGCQACDLVRAGEDRAEDVAEPATRPWKGALYRIGDAAAPRMISEAIFDGHRLAREIDQDDPAQPAPYLRERAGLA